MIILHREDLPRKTFAIYLPRLGLSRIGLSSDLLVLAGFAGLASARFSAPHVCPLTSHDASIIDHRSSTRSEFSFAPRKEEELRTTTTVELRIARCVRPKVVKSNVGSCRCRFSNFDFDPTLDLEVGTGPRCCKRRSMRSIDLVQVQGGPTCCKTERRGDTGTISREIPKRYMRRHDTKRSGEKCMQHSPWWRFVSILQSISNSRMGHHTRPNENSCADRTVSSPHAKIEDCHSLHRPNDPGRSRAARNRWSIILFPMLLWIVAAAGGGGGRRCTSSASYEAILFFHFVVTSALFAKKFRGFVCMPHV